MEEETNSNPSQIEEETKSNPSQIEEEIKSNPSQIEEETNSNPSSPFPSSSSSPPPPKKYDVFLSYSGRDTGLTFTSHLYGALLRNGISNTYKDVEELKKGKDIELQLMNAIEDSNYAIIVLSKNYATSPWCLKEITKIVECMGNSGRIRTIFYHLESDHARNLKSTKTQQRSCFWEGLKKQAEDPSHSKDLSRSEDLISSWKNALVTVANQYDDCVEDYTNEEKFIQDFTAKLSTELDAPIKNLEGYVGMTSRLRQLHSCVNGSSSDVRFIGIHGMGGIGKSTLATAYFNTTREQFDGKGFLPNVKEGCEGKENGLLDLQKKLLSFILGAKKDSFPEIGHVDSGKKMIRNRLCSRKVLVVLDDVSKLEQLDALAGSHEKKNGLDHDQLDIWFGRGSVIIVTTRYKDLLGEKYEKYEVKRLNSSEALKLFSLKAFESNEPPEKYKELSEQVVHCAEYLPLALNVFASLLRSKKDVNEWQGALRRLKKFPGKEIVEKLKISYDDLDATDQRIFLDIACFFKGHDKDYIIPILDSCGFNSEHGINNLIDRSLLEIRHGRILWMRDLLQKMGHDIVRRESSKQGRRPSRIWDVNEFRRILGKTTGLEKVEAIVVTFEKECRMSRFGALSNMEDLRLLMILGSFVFQAQTGGSTPTLDSLSNELKFLEWNRFPFTEFPTCFEPYGLVELKLIDSNLQRLWKYSIELPNLKVINLRNSRYFSTFEDFRVVPNLETLILEGCIELLEIHPSITLLGRLTMLNLKSCTSLEKLPPSIKGLNSLQNLNLNGCQKLCEIPEDIGDLEILKELDVTESGIKDLPLSIKDIKNLRILGRPIIYDVYLSFRGEDTPSGFTSYLHQALVREGLKTMLKGEARFQESVKAIESSRTSIVILSKNYVFSPWCLTELSKIVECMNNSGLIIVPIYYHVNPSDVRRLSGSYAKAFSEYENMHHADVGSWKAALNEVSNLSGWDLYET